VHTSTSEVYGTARFVPISEEHPLQGQSPYAASKIGADQIAMSYYLSYGLPVAIARPFNTFGPRQSNRAVIPTIISQIASGSRRIKLGSLSPTRDFNFVEDTVAGLIAIGLGQDAVGEVINLGSGYEISIGDTAALIASLMNADLEIVSDDERLRPERSEVQRLCADSSKAHNLVGWRSESGGAEGFKRALEKTISWFREPENLKRYKRGGYAV
jgi:dTDP-glucose 4,6-dehydratase